MRVPKWHKFWLLISAIQFISLSACDLDALLLVIQPCHFALQEQSLTFIRPGAQLSIFCTHYSLWCLLQVHWLHDVIVLIFLWTDLVSFVRSAIAAMKTMEVYFSYRSTLVLKHFGNHNKFTGYKIYVLVLSFLFLNFFYELHHHTCAGLPTVQNLARQPQLLSKCQSPDLIQSVLANIPTFFFPY